MYDACTSEVISKGIKRDTQLHLGHGIGLSEYRDIQAAFSDEFVDPNGLAIDPADAVADLQRGHASKTAQAHYLRVPHKLRGFRTQTVKAYHRESKWWQNITGKWSFTLTAMPTN